MTHFEHQSGGVSRRGFLAGTAAVAVASRAKTLAAGTSGAGASGRVAVVIHLAGGNDSWHCVPPTNSSAYRAARPTLALGTGETVRVGSSAHRLHAALSGVATLIERGQAAVLCDVAVPGGEDAHAHLALAWDEAALPLARPRDGWLCRAADSAPLALWTDAAAVPRAMSRAGRSTLVPPPVVVAPGQAGRPLADRLAAVAEFIASTPGDIAARLTLDGFDTHAGQASRQADLLGELSDSLVAFDALLTASGQAGRVLTVAYSESGRGLVENESGGTGHAAAGAVLAVGTGVRAGVDISWRDRPMDFRAVHAAVFDWLGIDSFALLGRRVVAAPLLARAAVA